MKIHFIGIGGIGISALAKYYLYNGHQISGSDVNYPNVFTQEEFSKITFYLGHKASNLDKNIDLVIYTNAIEKNNPELLKAKRLKIRCLSYPKALGQLTKENFTIAISGMHGKSTTTSMIADLFIKAGLDPLVIVGTKVAGFGPNGEPSNFRYGKNKILIIEADEYKKGFLEHFPDILVITNIEEEHLDCYKNLEDIKKTFKKFILKLNFNKNIRGFERFSKYLIYNSDNKNLKELVKENFNEFKLKNIKIKSYSIKNKPRNLKLKIPGKHNISNALAALKVAEIFNIEKEFTIKTLNKFPGIWRRLEFKGYLNGAKIYDDYGHHPTEIKATIKAAKELIKKGRIFLVFQPHQYHRTFSLFDKFINAFDDADIVVITDIYTVPGRESEAIKRKINSEMLVNEIRKHKKNVFYIKTFEEIKNFLIKNCKKGDLCIIMGAGDIWKLTPLLIN